MVLPVNSFFEVFNSLLFHFQVSALSFSENGSFFVTVGVRHVKFWYFDTESNKSKVRKTLIYKKRQYKFKSNTCKELFKILWSIHKLLQKGVDILLLANTP